MSDASERAPRQRGRASSERALIEAAVACFAEVGPNDVSVRTIAERAGVNHGLVHHYFGSKAGLVEAVVNHVSDYFAEELKTQTGMMLLTSADPTPVTEIRALVRIIIDGAMPEGRTQFPMVDAGAEVVRGLGVTDDRDARIISAQILSMVVGWLLLESFLVNAIGGQPEDTFELRARIRASGLRLVTATVQAQS